MVEKIIFTSGIIIVILLLLYLQIITKIKITTKISRLFLKHIHPSSNSAVKFHLRSYAFFFKKNMNLRSTLISIVITFIVAFIFYNYLFFTVPISNSMQPTFEEGDLVLMQKYDTTPHEGDIVMFEMALIGRKNQIITHRIYKIFPDGNIRTKGDATPVDNWEIPQERIYAKAPIIGGKPIVIKSIGYYFLDVKVSSTYSKEFGFMQAITRSGKQLGLLIFVICLVAYTWISVKDMKRQKKYRRRN